MAPTLEQARAAARRQDWFAILGLSFPVEWDPESFATPWMVAGVLLLANDSLHRVRRRRWGHRRFCQSCRSYLRQQALLAVGGHCLQRGTGLHGLRDWREWWGKRRIVGRLNAGVGNRAAVGRWELVLT